MKLALQLYSVRDEMEKDFLGTLKKVKEMGYDGGELAGLYGKSGKEVKEMFDEAGLIPISAHVSYQDLMSDIDGLVRTYKEIGCKYIAIPYLPEELRYGTEKYPEIVEGIKKIGEVCKNNGISLLYHNHDFEFEKTENGDYVLDALYNAISSDLLQTEIDTCWVNVGGENPSDYVRKYTGRAPVVHLKDFSGRKSENMYKLIGIESKDEKSDGFEFRPLGMGVQEIQSIVDAAKDAGAEWVVAEQDEPTLGLSRLESAQKSIDYMKNINY
ncbi:MAG: sugar phosphate isomerase/epimerase [Clostridia bacterium]|nr:sugar phosphate isomerase/epimerase [Clostridia bacterium]MBQ7788071.1 sugar phosphate isomerase/epimerase [Clostridia bacterium]